MRKTSAVLALTLLLAAPAFAQDRDQVPRPAAADAAQSAPGEAPPPAQDGAPLPLAVTQAPANPPMTGPRILIATSMGDIVLQLDSVRAPKSVANVLRYVREKHYDNTVFYRVSKGFVIQMGSWLANGKGKGVHPGGVPLEANNGLSNLRGTVALGRAEEPDSASAEFYINLADNTPLDHEAGDGGNSTGYAVFGQVESGMDVVDAIGDVPTGDNGPMPGQAPITPVVVKKVTLLK